jgi:hypothetical protein
MLCLLRTPVLAIPAAEVADEQPIIPGDVDRIAS